MSLAPARGEKRTSAENVIREAHKRTRIFDRSLYTVGWICAIATEYIAAQLFLDEEHDSDHTTGQDDNDYVFGRIGKHNVVLAVLPSGEYGTNSAAVVVRDMIRTFRNLRVVLLVGIGGGAPTVKLNDDGSIHKLKRDIRLGDIVVSSPGNGQGGVYQYDRGKAIQNQPFQPTFHLNSPPKSLITAVAGLRTLIERKGHTIGEDIEAVLAAEPRLQKKYSRPDLRTDRLYRSTYAHAAGGEDKCVDCCSQSYGDIIPRPARGDIDDDPAIHYGLIASGNSLLKDAVLRDTLAEQTGILCFETEAAGIVSQLPCLVIRGICDYADSHKNKEWQGYAAMTAAAYTKKLLLRLAPTRLEAERTIQDAIDSVEVQVQTIGTQVDQLQSMLRESESRRHTEAIYRWLQSSDPSTNYHKALNARHKGSGSWLLEHEAFLAWKAGRASNLWLYGNSGCGKTVLSSTVIDHLQSNFKDSSVIYFYFDFTDKAKEKLEGLLRSLVAQLGLLQKDCEKLLYDLFTSCGEDGRHPHRQPSCDELCKLLSAMLEAASNTWIVIDALDECITRVGGKSESVLAWLTDIACNQHVNARIVATSRPEGDIRSAMDKIAGHTPNGSLRKLSIQGSSTAQDIRSYVRFRLLNDDNLHRWKENEDVKRKIEASVLNEADDMFRLAVFRLDLLRHCYNEDELEKALTGLPKTLGDVYQRMIQRIPEARLPVSIRILQLLYFSPRPLTVEELSHAIAVEVDTEPYFNRKKCLTNPEDIALYCSGLTILVDQPTRLGVTRSPLLQLTHLSVKEFLKDGLSPELKKSFEEETGKLMLADVCVSYLLQIQGLISTEMNRFEDEEYINALIRRKLPFAEYCSEYWYIYAAMPRGPPDELSPKIVDLLKENGPHSIIYSNLHQMDDPDHLFMENQLASPLYYASYSGLLNEVQMLLNQGAEVNAQGGSYGGALHAASYKGYKDIVRLLLEAGADVSDCQGLYGYALLAALGGYGSLEVVELLIDAGADVNVRGPMADSTLLLAIGDGRDAEVIKKLLDAGADVTGLNDDHMNPVVLALQEGYGPDVVKLLLDAGANANAHEDPDYSPISIACRYDGTEETVKLLLDAGANVNARGSRYGSALQAVLRGGRALGMVKLLLVAGADITPQESSIALANAILEDYEKLVTLLLEMDVDFHPQQAEYGSALHIAAQRGHQGITEQILRHQARTGCACRDSHGWTPSMIASVYGHSEISDFLSANETRDMGISPPELVPATLVYGGYSRAVLSNDGLTFTAENAAGQELKETLQCRADHPFPFSSDGYYFEVSIINSSRESLLGIGVGQGISERTGMPGWRRGSWGYHGDDGKLFDQNGWGKHYGPTYATGDVIGCGGDKASGTIFFTKNGQHLGQAKSGIQARLFAVIGIGSRDVKVSINFGALPFRYRAR